VIFICNPWVSYMAQLERECVEEEKRRELELDRQVTERRELRRPIRMRPHVVPAEALAEWDAYQR